MTARKYVTVISIAVLSFSMLVCVAVIERIDATRSKTAIEETLYIPSPKVLKKLSFGYDGLLADIYWTRAVQYYGTLHHQESGPKRYDLLYPLLDISTTLDPKLLPVYQFGSIFLSAPSPEGAGQPDKAIELIQRGIAANPSEWRLYLNLGFTYYYMKDYANAGRAFGEGSQIPGATPYMKVLQAGMAERASGPEMAFLIWQQLHDTTEDQKIRAVALSHLIALKIDSEVPILARLVRDYNEKTGHLPASFREMVAAGWLRSIPKDPTGDEYLLTPDGRVVVQSPREKPYVKYGLPNGPQGPEPTETTPTT